MNKESTPFPNDLIGMLGVFWSNIIQNPSIHAQEYKKLEHVWNVFLEMDKSLHETQIQPAMLFFGRTRSSFLAAAGMSMSGMVPEAYMAIRVALESALYGFAVHNKPARWIIYTDRDNDKKSSAKVRKEFQIVDILKEIKKIDEGLAELVGMLYEWAICDGAHPNPNGLNNIRLIERCIQTEIFCSESKLLAGCMNMIAQSATAALILFQNIFKDRCDHCGVSEKINELASR